MTYVGFGITDPQDIMLLSNTSQGFTDAVLNQLEGLGFIQRNGEGERIKTEDPDKIMDLVEKIKSDRSELAGVLRRKKSLLYPITFGRL